jgi:hypothetical protein
MPETFFEPPEINHGVCVISVLVPKAAVLAKKEFQMTRGIRGFTLVAGCAALLSTQAAYAAPMARSFSAIDPLVSLSVLGSQESNAAVCGAAAGATAGAAEAAAAAANENSQGPAGCVLPVTTPAPAAAPMGAVAPVVGGPGIGMLPLLLGLAAIIGVAALVLSNGGHGKGDLTPVSPA